MRYLYVTFEQQLFSEEVGYYRIYGIQCRTAVSEETLAVFQDVSTDRLLMEELARRCTQGQLSPIHLMDVILDVLD